MTALHPNSLSLAFTDCIRQLDEHTTKLEARWIRKTFTTFCSVEETCCRRLKSSLLTFFCVFFQFTLFFIINSFFDVVPLHFQFSDVVLFFCICSICDKVDQAPAIFVEMKLGETFLKQIKECTDLYLQVIYMFALSDLVDVDQTGITWKKKILEN